MSSSDDDEIICLDSPKFSSKTSKGNVKSSHTSSKKVIADGGICESKKRGRISVSSVVSKSKTPKIPKPRSIQGKKRPAPATASAPVQNGLLNRVVSDDEYDDLPDIECESMSNIPLTLVSESKSPDKGRKNKGQTKGKKNAVSLPQPMLDFVISDDEYDEFPTIPSPAKRKRINNTATKTRNGPCKIKLPKNNHTKNVPSSSPEKDSEKAIIPSLQEDYNTGPPDFFPFTYSPTKKRKTLADIVTDIYETSTDEIGSDEITASSEKLNKGDPLPRNISYLVANENPCCSKSLQKDFSTKTSSLPFMSDSEEDDLPDIDVVSKTNNWKTSQISSSSSSQDYNSSQSTLSTVPVSRKFQVTRPKNGRNAQVEAEKAEKKEALRLEKERKKQEEVRAKELRKATSELQRSVRPGESIKYMKILLDSEIVNKCDSLVPQIVAAEIKYEIVSEPRIGNSICFKREIMQQAMGDDLQIKLLSKFQDEDQIMVAIDSDKLIPLVYARLNNLADIGSMDLITWVESIKASSPRKKLTVILFDLDKYFRKVKKNTQQDFRNRILNAGEQPQKSRKKRAPELPEVTETEVDSALIEMQLLTGVNYRSIKSGSEFGATLIQYTKAIADAPFKKQRIESDGFDWFALSDATGSVKVEKDGAGLRNLWVGQLQQFNSVGSDMAIAIVNQYPSPMKLMEAYRACRNEQEGQSLLKDLSVITGVGPLARTRKVGVETSKKFYRFFTSTNGDRFLGSTLDSK